MPFYAILNIINVGLVIDFEPMMPPNMPIFVVGALQSYKLDTKAISLLQSMPRGVFSCFLSRLGLLENISNQGNYRRQKFNVQKWRWDFGSPIRELLHIPLLFKHVW
jgi:hypothetical protein